MTNLEMAKINPASVFSKPHEVLADKSLSRKQKIDILRRWAYDEREMAVAEEENMQGPSDDGHTLDDILNCLLALGVDSDQDHPPPTKQG